MRKLNHEEIIARQRACLHESRLPVTVVLNDIRSLYNVGSIFRTGDGAGVEKIWLCGITGFPPQSQISKTALGAQDRVPWEYSKDAVGIIRDLKQKNYSIILLEQTSQSVVYHDFIPQGPVCLVLGNEIEGVGEELVHLSDAAVEIEMAGVKNSLNVSVAFGIVVYHLRQYLKKSVHSF